MKKKDRKIYREERAPLFFLNDFKKNSGVFLKRNYAKNCLSWQIPRREFQEILPIEAYSNIYNCAMYYYKNININGQQSEFKKMILIKEIKLILWMNLNKCRILLSDPATELQVHS